MNTKKISQKISSNQKPIELDIHLKYVCTQCGQTHWLSISEASTKKFKIVCFCGLVFGVKRVKDFKLLFHKKLRKDITKNQEAPKPLPIIPTEILNQTMGVLVSYGFTKTEAKTMITKCYEALPIDNPTVLLKHILESIKNTNVK